MYKLPKGLVDQSVYKGWRVALGWQKLKTFLEGLDKKGYRLKSIPLCVTGYDTIGFCEVTAIFENAEAELFKCFTRWEVNGTRDLLSLNMDLVKIEMEEKK